MTADAESNESPAARVALVVARLYPDLADEIAAAVESLARDRGATVVERITVPGVYDAPSSPTDSRTARTLTPSRCSASSSPGTPTTTRSSRTRPHASSGASRSTTGRPVAFGVVGPDASAAEAHERVEKATNAVDAALDTHAALAAVDDS